MKALLILAVAALLAWLYARLVSRADGQTLMALNILILVPWVVIAVGAIVALVIWA